MDRGITCEDMARLEGAVYHSLLEGFVQGVLLKATKGKTRRMVKKGIEKGMDALTEEEKDWIRKNVVLAHYKNRIVGMEIMGQKYNREGIKVDLYPIGEAT